jgi:squalene cyclase
MSRARAEALKFIASAQVQDGGWGPYKDSPPEIFDTALAILALSEIREELEVPEMIKRGRAFLRSQQLADGSWPATTRPSGSESYAQQISTTGWATLALLHADETGTTRRDAKRRFRGAL